jgi:hypothetical protein
MAAELLRTCGGIDALARLQRLWLSAQSLRLDSFPETAFYPAELVAQGAMFLDVRVLLWDLAPCREHLDPELGAAVLPPIPLGRWDRLRLPLGCVDLDARIGDPRLGAASRRAPAVIGGAPAIRPSHGSHAVARDASSKGAVAVGVRVSRERLRLAVAV